MVFESHFTAVLTVVCIFLCQVQIFDSFESLNSSDLNLKIGSVAFVLDTSVMYILTADGWTSAVVCLSQHLVYFFCIIICVKNNFTIQY